MLVKLVVRTPRKWAEVVSAVLFEAGAGAVEELDRARCLVVYAETPDAAVQIENRARSLLSELASAPSGVTFAVEVDESSDWASAWTKHLRQIALTPGLVIQPVWDETPAPPGARPFQLQVSPTEAG